MFRSVFFIFLLMPVVAEAQDSNNLKLGDSLPLTNHIMPLEDSLLLIKDSTVKTDSIPAPVENINNHKSAGTITLDQLLKKNRFLNTGTKPVSHLQRVRPHKSSDILFYGLFALVLIFAILKTVYAKYFNTMWRVFLNTSMRQSQLSEQLRQSGQPALFFNLLFILICGWYVFLLFKYFNSVEELSNFKVLGFVSLSILGIYIGKYLILKFIGWVSGISNETGNYIFIVFLINKIFSICLLPLLLIMAFASPQMGWMAVMASFVLVGLMILFRFVRAYGVFQGRFKINSFHFLLYIAGMEVIPLLILYKIALLYLSKKL